MSNTTSAEKITILQWNNYGLKTKLPTLSLALAEVTILFCSKTLSLSLTYRCQIIEVTNCITAKEEAEGSAFYYERTCMLSPFLFAGLVGTELKPWVWLYLFKTQFYKSITYIGSLILEHIFAAVSNSSSILCGDFSVHNPKWTCPLSPSANRSCRSGTYLNRVSKTFLTDCS